MCHHLEMRNSANSHAVEVLLQNCMEYPKNNKTNKHSVSHYSISELKLDIYNYYTHTLQYEIIILLLLYIICNV